MDIDKNIHIRVDGVMTANNSIPIDVLSRIANSLQHLIFDVAKYDLIDEEVIKLDNFKIELCGFKGGSAVPAFTYTRTTQIGIGIDLQKQKERVDESVAKILSIANTGEYNDLITLYPNPEARNAIVKDLFEFTNCVGNSKLSIVKDNLEPVYKVIKLKKTIADKLTTRIEPVENIELEPQTKLAKIKEGKRRTIIHVFDEKVTSTDFSPEVINYKGVQYLLRYPLRCKYDFVDNMVVIENEMLGIYAYGQSADEAEDMFNAEFHYIFERYNELPDEKLDSNVLFVKGVLNQIVKSRG